ncbi:hypothetical protein SCUCBS95973_008517 [Sporothrix curviconia]|uniref:Major facilitator superfamily (MFS) profile domain-containing protein n=1 Tax=Sporothrix curviconia TaxID=1260050 RepID=A0ABP0CQ35_9PEZI
MANDRRDSSVSGAEQRNSSSRTVSHTEAYATEEVQHDVVAVVDPEKALVQSQDVAGPQGQLVSGDGEHGPSGGPGKPGGRGGLPPNHPMHPSQFVGDRYDRRALATLLGSFCVMVRSVSFFGWINCIGVFQQYYETHQLIGYSESTISWIISAELFLMFMGAPIVGKLFDNFGPRYLLLVGTLLHVLGLMMASLSSKYYQLFLSQGVCSPLGCSMLFFPAMNSCISWFLKRRALAFGVIASGASLGGVIFPIIVTRLVPTIGFAWTMRVCAFLILALLVVGNACITCRLRPRKAGVTLHEFLAPLSETPYRLLAAASFCGYLGLFVPISYIVVQSAAVGMNTDLQGYMVPILNAASLFGRTIPGHAADKLGRFNTMLSMCLFSVVCVFAVWVPATTGPGAKTPAATVVFAVLYGFASGAFISVMPTLVAEITGDMSKLGVRNGTSFAILSIATLVGTPISGALLSACDGQFWGLQIFTGLSLAVCAAFLLATRVSLAGFRLVKV